MVSMEKTLWQFIWRYSRKDQFRVLALTLVSFPFLYLSLEMPKIIINTALKPGKVTHDLFGVMVIGAEWYLWGLCLVFMMLVMISGSLKMRINTMKGVMGERMLRRLRYQMIEQILRFPPDRFHGTSAGALVSMVNAETEPLAGYAGDALALPVFQGGTLLTILIFMFVQDLRLGLASLVAMPLQVFFIPRLQRQINILARQRVAQARVIADRLDDTVAGIRDIRINGIQQYILAQFSGLFGRTFEIRFAIYQKKFLMKFLNNAMAQLTPFLFFAIGGYQVLQGELTLGALVAALAAQKELYAPWKELLGFYQIQQDTRTKYDQLYEQFCLNPDEKPSLVMLPTGGLTGQMMFDHVVVAGRAPVTLDLAPGACLAITSDQTMMLEAWADMLNRQSRPDSGAIMVDGINFHDLADGAIGPVIGYVGPDSYIFEGTIFDNVFCGAWHYPPPPEEQTSERQREALASGNHPNLGPGSWLSGYDAPEEWWQQIAHALDADDGMIDPLQQDFAVGRGGARLTLAGRQKLALARAIAKKPRWLMAHRPLQALGPQRQSDIIVRVQKLLPDTSIIWLDHRIYTEHIFDKRIVV